MSSGEIVYILAFIVLPTAILVSAIWAIVFVRRRPEREPRQQDELAVHAYPEQEAANEQTAVLTTIEPPSDPPLTAEPESAPEPEAPVSQPVIHPDPEPVAAGTLLDEDEYEEANGPAEAPASDIEPVPEDGLLETPVLQTTEELDDVVQAVAALDEEHVADTASEPVEDIEEPVPVQQDPPTTDEHEDERFETSELPVVSEPVRESRSEPEQDDPPAGRQRRKQSVKLLPGDPEMPRQRGRNRETPRQVPQLNRAFRRRDSSTTDLPPESEGDAESPSPRD